MNPKCYFYLILFCLIVPLIGVFIWLMTDSSGMIEEMQKPVKVVNTIQNQNLDLQEETQLIEKEGKNGEAVVGTIGMVFLFALFTFFAILFRDKQGIRGQEGYRRLKEEWHKDRKNFK